MNKKYPIFLGIVFYFCFLLLTPLGLFSDWIPPSTHKGFFSITRIDPGDDTGYYAYLRSAFFDGDFDFINEGNYAHIEEITPTGYVFNNWQIGQSVLFLPFFLSGHLAAGLYNSLGYAITIDGYSFPYYIATAVASQTYLFFGLLMLFHILRQRFDGFIALISTLAIWLGSPLVYYTFIRQRMAHTAEFFLAVVFLWYWLRERNSEDPLRHAILGGVLGLLCMVRLLDIGFLALYLVDQIFLMKSKQGVSLSWRTKALFIRMLGFGTVFILMLMPQFLTWNQLNGVPLPSRHVQFVGQGLAVFSLLPFFTKLVSMFLDLQWGLVLSAPLMVLGLIGVFVKGGVTKELRPGIAAYLLFLFLMIVLYPEDSASYGHRHLISTLPILGWGLAGLVGWCSANRLSNAVAFLIIMIGVGLQYFMLIQYKVTLEHNDPEFTFKALSEILPILFERMEILLRSTNWVQLMFLDHPQSWGYQDILFLIIFPCSQLILMVLILSIVGSVNRLPDRWTGRKSTEVVSGGLVLASLILIVLILEFAPSKTQKEISNRKLSSVLINEGVSSLSRGRDEEGVSFLKRASMLEPQLWSIYFRLAKVYEMNHEIVEANKYYRQLLSIYSSHDLTLLSLGKNHIALGETDRGEAYLKSFVPTFPVNYEVYNALHR